MKEYYPERYKLLKSYIKQGRWNISGSSVDECDVLIPGPESILRQVLYGNRFFKTEFGKVSKDFMLPDCFGFPASTPSLLAHAGLLGFSTQKLSWGCAKGIPFNVGVWEGPDGKSIIAALNATNYNGRIEEGLDTTSVWVERIRMFGDRYGLYFDFRYYGVGDQGGAPREDDVKRLLASLNNKYSRIKIIPAASDRMYKEITPELREKLPVYKGDLLLTGSSAGVLTSQAYMKRWNRENEHLALAAEKIAVMAHRFGINEYPKEKLNNAWERVLANQMHDILAGTSIPKAYEYSWNDEVIAMNGFAAVLKNSA
ncbi:hypothetical protein ES705_32735 [subsurface metagenome]